MKIRLDSSAKSRLVMGVAFAVPFATYMLYGFLAPSGVMQNHRASSGAYMYYAQNFLGPNRSFQQIYRPEFYQKEQSLSLYAYQKKIEALKKADSEEVVPDVHHPTMWH